MHRIVVVTLAAAALAFAAAPASAQSKPAAEALFQKGLALVRDGRWAEACSAFEQSQALEPQIGTLLNLANCHEQLGKTATAWAEFREVSDRDANPRRKTIARQRADALEPRLVKLQINAAPTPRLTVTRNGEDVSRLVGTPIPVDPGEQTVEASAPERERWSQTVMAQGDGTTVTIDVPELPPAPPAPPHEAGPTPPGPGPAPGVRAAPTGLGTRRVAALGTGAAALVAIGAGSYFGLHASSLHGQADDLCDERWVCTGNGAQLEDDARTSARVSTALLATGVVAAGAAAYLWFTGDSGAGEHVAIVPAVSPRDVGVAVLGRF